MSDVSFSGDLFNSFASLTFNVLMTRYANAELNSAIEWLFDFISESISRSISVTTNSVLRLARGI